MNSLKICTVIVMLLLVSQVMALPPLNRPLQPAAAETQALSYDEYINANNILAFVTNQGMLFRDLSGLFGYDYGFFYPYVSTTSIENGTNITSVLYASGLWMLAGNEWELKGAVAYYSSEFYPGPMLGSSYDPNGMTDPAYRVYKLYADSMEGNPNSDYLQWPTAHGAPVDVDGKPLLIGKQTLYSVYNDAYPLSNLNNEAGSVPPSGVEVHQTVWAFDQSGNDTLFFPNQFTCTPTHTSAVTVEAIVADPFAVTGHDYLVEIVPVTSDSAFWRLVDVTTSTIVLDQQGNFSGDASSPVADGLRIQVKALGARFHAFQETANAAGPVNPPVSAAFSSAGFPTPGAQDPPADQQTTGQRWAIHTADNGGSSGGGTRSSFNAFYSRTTRDGMNLPEFMKGTYEFRFTGAGNYGVVEADFGYDQDYLVEVPFEIWDIGKNSPTDSSDDVRLIPVMLEIDDNGTFNLGAFGAGYEHSVSSLDDDPFTDWIYLYRDPTALPGEQSYQSAVAEVQGGGDLDRSLMHEILARLVFVAWDAGIAPPFASPMPEIGTVFQILPGEGFTSVDTFLFTTVIPEVQLAGGESNALYVKYDLFNKSGQTIAPMYLSIWSDPDLGGSADDLIGCDTLQQVFYAYNGDYSDTQFGVPVPAVGFTVLQGPIVPSPGDIAVSFGRAVPNYRNLGVTAFSRYINGTDPNSAYETFNYMQGLQSDGSPLPNGTKYMVPGDPVGMTGDLDFAPADRRMMGSIGPISMAPGDSQQVVVKWGVGQGTDRLSSITKLKLLLSRKSNLQVSADSAVFVSTNNVIPSVQNVLISNLAITPYAWQAQHKQWWLGMTKWNGSGSPDTLGLYPTALLPPGIYTDTVTILSYDNVGGPILIPVTYQVVGSTCCVGTTGNVDNVGIVNLSDLSHLIAYLTTTPRPILPCPAEANINLIGGIDLTDLSILIGYLTMSPGPDLPDCPLGAVPTRSPSEK